MQARLNAESGLTFALAQLKIYKEARKKIDKNKDLQKQVSPNMLEGMVTRPFKVPIPLGKGAGGLQKSALADFEKGLLIVGDLFVQCNPVTGFLNPNSLRMKKPKCPEQQNSSANSSSSFGSSGPATTSANKMSYECMMYNESEDKRSVAEIIETDLTKTLGDLLEAKKEEDEDFEDRYGDLEAFKLIRELKYYVRAKGDMPETEKAEVDAEYMNVNAKHAPLSSISELYALQGWPDAITNLFKDKLSVHQVRSINLNKITQSQLSSLFPEFSEDQLKDFFKYRDGSPEDKIEPHSFNTEEDFKNYIMKELNVIDEDSYNKRKQELKLAKVSFGVAGNLFRCISEGKVGKSVYKLESFVNIPVKEPSEDEISQIQTKKANWEKNGKQGPMPTLPPPELLDPRVVEINII